MDNNKHNNNTNWYCKHKKSIYVFVPIVSGLALVGTIAGVILLSSSDGVVIKSMPQWAYVLGALVWTVIPPVWFYLEYFYLYKRCDASKDEEFDRFKHGQQLAAAIWAGLLAFLFIVYEMVFKKISLL